MQPIHVIDIEHRWQEVDRVELDSGAFQTTEKCLDCGEERNGFGLAIRKRPRSIEWPNSEMMARIGETIEKFKREIETFREMYRQLVVDTKYCDIDDLAVEIDKRYGRLLNAKELPFYQLDNWVHINNNKKIQRQVMLAYKQGLVCNRCDSIFPSLDELEIDHIRPKKKGGKEELTNLQLLCRACNRDKGDNDPTKRDISPFNFHGEPCVHRITCVELNHLLRSYESHKRKNIS